MVETKVLREVKILQYYNVLFHLFIRNDEDLDMYKYLENNILSGMGYQMKDIYDWCKLHGISCFVEYEYIKKFNLLVNFWNWLSFNKFCKENGIRQLKRKKINKRV